MPQESLLEKDTQNKVLGKSGQAVSDSHKDKLGELVCHFTAGLQSFRLSFSS